MDNLKSLMDKKEYELVIKLTNSSQDVTSLFYRISSLIALNQPLEALKTISENKKLLSKDLSLLMKIHIEILCLLNRFDEARKEMDYYANLPYQSQQVEEMLIYLPKYINEEEKKQYCHNDLNDEEIIARLTSKNNHDVLLGLNALKQRDVLPFLNEIKTLMVHFPNQLIRSYSLLLLVAKQINKDLLFNRDGQVITINPQNMKPPFVGEDFKALIKRVNSSYKDTTLIETMISLMSSYILYYYPEDLPSEDIETFLTALMKVSADYLCSPVENFSKLVQEKGLVQKEVDAYIQKINKALNSNI